MYGDGTIIRRVEPVPSRNGMRVAVEHEPDNFSGCIDHWAAGLPPTMSLLVEMQNGVFIFSCARTSSNSSNFEWRSAVAVERPIRG